METKDFFEKVGDTVNRAAEVTGKTAKIVAELPRLLKGVGLCLLWAILLRPAAGWGDTPLLIYTLLDALPVRGLTPASLQSTAVPAYYVVMALLLCTSASSFFRFNRCMYGRNRSAAGACPPAPLPVRETV